MPSKEGQPALFAIVLGLYVLSFPYHPGLRSPNELCRLWQARAIVERHTLRLNETIREYGYVGDLSVWRGELFPSKAPLLSFLDVPLYAALRALAGGDGHRVSELLWVYLSRLCFTVLPTLLMLVWVRRFLRTYVSAMTADLVTVTYALGALAFSYSLLFMSHQLTAVLAFVAFYAAWRSTRREWKASGYAISGVALGATLMSEYTGALAVLGIVFYITAAHLGSAGVVSLGERARLFLRAAGWLIVGASPFLAALMVYHAVCFGGPLESGYKHLLDTAYQGWHLGGFLGIRFPDPRAFILSFFSPLRGLFTLSPFLLLALPGFVLLSRMARGQAQERALQWMSAGLFLGYAYFTSAFSYDSWGWTTGPRHLTPLIPFLLLPVALTVECVRRRKSAWWLGLGSGLCAVSVLVTGLLTQVNYFPDTVSNGLFGLVVPLCKDGFLPPSVLAMAIPNPWAGWVMVLMVLVAAVWVLVAVSRPSAGAGMVGCAVCVGFLALMRLTTRNDNADLRAQAHLKSVWLTPPGTKIEL